MLKHLLLTAIVAFIVLQVSFAQPSNDNCANAIPLTINAICTNGQTNTATSEALDAGGCTSANSRTVWYTFTATQTSHHIYVDVISAGLDVTFTLYSGTCGSLTNLGCTDAGGVDADEQITYTSLTIGQTYRLRVSAYGSTNGNFCVSVRGAPSNDACSNAITLTPNGSPVLGTNILATNGWLYYLPKYRQKRMVSIYSHSYYSSHRIRYSNANRKFRLPFVPRLLRQFECSTWHLCRRG